MIQEDALKFAQELAGDVMTGRYGEDYKTAREVAFEYMGTFYGEQYPESLGILDKMLPTNRPTDVNFQ